MNNDLISRQAVLDEMYKKADGDAITVGFIKNLPPVNPQPKTGHWIDAMPLTPWLEYRAECSECHCFGMRSDKYCRSCGAKMVSQESEE